MGIVSGLTVFVNGDSVNHTKLNGLKTNLVNEFNGNIDNANIKSGAGISYSKLNINNGIVDADIKTTANISDSKLAQITTTGKVAGSALTTLDTIPVAAGIIPVANIDTGSTGNKIVILDGSGNLPAVGGASLTGTTAMKITGIVGSWVDKSSDYASQAATTDLFITANTVGASKGVDIQTSPEGSSWTSRSHGENTSAVNNAVNAACIVAKGEYWKVVVAGGATPSVYIRAIGV